MKPFLAGRLSHSGPALRSLSGETSGPVAAVGGSPAGHAGQGHGPSVECVKQGDKVVRLVITCTCGERIEVECLYPAGG